MAHFYSNEPWISQKPSHILITLGYYEEHPEQDPNMTEEQLQRINQRKQMRTLNAIHQLAEILEKQGNSVTFVSIPQKSWWLDSGCHQTLLRTSSTIKSIKIPLS